MKNKKCPNCGSRNTEEHGLNAGDTRWTLCRDCGWNTPIEVKDRSKKEGTDDA